MTSPSFGALARNQQEAVSQPSHSSPRSRVLRFASYLVAGVLTNYLVAACLPLLSGATAYGCVFGGAAPIAVGRDFATNTDSPIRDQVVCDIWRGSIGVEFAVVEHFRPIRLDDLSEDHSPPLASVAQSLISRGIDRQLSHAWSTGFSQQSLFRRIAVASGVPFLVNTGVIECRRGSPAALASVDAAVTGAILVEGDASACCGGSKQGLLVPLRPMMLPLLAGGIPYAVFIFLAIETGLGLRTYVRRRTLLRLAGEGASVAPNAICLYCGHPLVPTMGRCSECGSERS